jgi:drug/metabolite transporter (DMT)-like permease
MHLSRHQKALLSVALCTIIWSIASPFFKWAMQTTPPFTLAFYRFFFATLIMLPIARKKIKIRFEDFYRIFLLAVTGVTFNISFFYLGLSLAQSIDSPIIASVMPIFLVFGSMIFLHERPKIKVIMGIFVSLIGVFIIILRPVDHMSLFGSILGNIYLIISVLSLVSYTLLLKRFKPRYASSTLIFWMFLIATITFFPLYILQSPNIHSLFKIDKEGIFGIVYGTLFSSLLAQVCYNYSVKRLNSDEIGLFTYIGPIVTALVAIPLLHEQITFSYLLGSLFVFLGLFIAEVKLRYHPFHHHIPDANDSWLESGP